MRRFAFVLSVIFGVISVILLLTVALNFVRLQFLTTTTVESTPLGTSQAATPAPTYSVFASATTQTEPSPTPASAANMPPPPNFSLADPVITVTLEVTSWTLFLSIVFGLLAIRLHKRT